MSVRVPRNHLMELRVLIKVEAFPYMDHAVVRVIGICTEGSHGGPTCEGHSLITRVDVGELEELGVANALLRVIRSMLESDPALEGFLLH